MRGWRTALRIARREARRAKGRSILVLAMIAIPVAALSFAAVGYDTFTLTPDERADRMMGSGQAVMTWPVDEPVFQFPFDLLFVPRRPPADTTPEQPADPGQATIQPTVERLLALLPAGTRAMRTEMGRLNVRTAAGTGSVNARMIDYAEPLARGIFTPRSGRAPAAPDEIALTPEATRRLGAGIGGTVRLSDGSRTFRVVGTVEDPSDLSATTIVLPTGALAAGMLADNRRDVRWLVGTPGALTWSDVERLNEKGVVAVSRYVLANPPDPAEYGDNGAGSGGSELAIMVLVGGLVVLEIILLAGPAFAVGARRRQRDLALVAAVGGTPAHVRRVVLADGVVLGTVAAVTGTALGIAVAVATHSLFERLGDQRSGAFRVFPTALAVLAGLAVVTGVLAALVPAWISSRQDVVAALAGRRGITRSRRRWWIIGAGLAAAGAGIGIMGALRVNAALIVAGLVAVELGLVMATPAIVGLVARLGRILSLAPRVALRNTSRNRTAAAPAISAVMAAVIASLAVAVVASAEFAREAERQRTSLSEPGQVSLFGGGKGGGAEAVSAETLTILRNSLPVTQIYQIGTPTCDTGFCDVSVQRTPERTCPYAREILRREPTAAEQRAALRDRRCDGVGKEYTYAGGFSSDRGLTLIIEPDAVGAVAALSGANATAATAALRAGKVLVSDPRDMTGGRVTLKISTFTETKSVDVRTVTVDAYAPPQPIVAPIVLMSRDTARSLGLGANEIIVLATTSRMPTQAEVDRAEAAFNGNYYVNLDRGSESDNLFLVVLAIVTAVITLAAAAIATGLAAADSRADLATLAAVGASPRVRRMLSLSQAGVIAGLGSFLGVVAGLGASMAVLFALNQGYATIWPVPYLYPIQVPWLNVGFALVVVPLIAMLGAGLLTRSRLPIERRL